MIIQKRMLTDKLDVWRDIKYCDEYDAALKYLEEFQLIDPTFKYRLTQVIWD
jgi:hypothetical protein